MNGNSFTNNFGPLRFGNSICVAVNGNSQNGFFIASQNDLLYWGSTIDNQSRLVVTPINSVKSLVRY